MVSKSKHRCAPFKGYHGVTQCNPLSLNLFNIVLYEVIRSWTKIITEEATGIEEFNCAVRKMSSFFYEDESLLASTWLEWIQWEFDVLVGIFFQVVLQKNVQNMVGWCDRPFTLSAGTLTLPTCRE